MIDKTFIRKWSRVYDRVFQGSEDETEEKAIRAWLSTLPETKYLDKEHFVRLGRWKTKRQTSNYKKNNAQIVQDVTRFAYQASGPLVKLNTLRQLRGVGVAVAATILHFLHPGLYPIFDYHARTTLKEEGLWQRQIEDDSPQAWLEYIDTMRKLARSTGATLREVDKALFAYDKYPHSIHSMQVS